MTATVPAASANLPSPNSRSMITAVERRRAGVDQVVAEQDDAEQAVGLREQRERELRAALAALRAMLQPIAVRRHHRRLGEREEPRGDEQHGERDAERGRAGCRPSGRGAAACGDTALAPEQDLEHELAAEVGEDEKRRAGEDPVAARRGRASRSASGRASSAPNVSQPSIENTLLCVKRERLAEHLLGEQDAARERQRQQHEARARRAGTGSARASAAAASAAVPDRSVPRCSRFSRPAISRAPAAPRRRNSA